MNKLAVAVAGLLLAGSGPALAHHAFSAVYDENKPITMKGTVTKVEWQNPHIHFYVDVADSSGRVVNWAVEGGTPNQLYRRGWRRDSLKIGDVVTVEGFRSRTESHFAVNGHSVTLENGRRLFSASNDGAPGQAPDR